jgi:sugar lactone lactonase YvrE
VAQLNGLDISPDGSFLIVAQSATNGGNGTFHRLDLKTGEVTNITYPRASGEDGGWDVAIGSHGRALVTTQGSFWTPVRQINLATNAITLRLDAPGSFDNMPRPRAGICRSADGSRFYFLEPECRPALCLPIARQQIHSARASTVISFRAALLRP